jgi:hypothetical protein
MEYSVTDRTRQAELLDVDLSLTIMEGPSILYTHPPVRVQALNGQTAARIEHLTATARKGTFTVQATVRYRGVLHVQSAELRVE